MLDTLAETVSRSYKRLPCAQCGENLIAPIWSEYVAERCVRHVWSCEACGYEFETTVYLRASAA
jgi:ribosomal protein L37AE/L43A